MDSLDSKYSPQHKHVEMKDSLAMDGGQKDGHTEQDPLARYAHLDEKKLLRKMDIRLIPILSALYLLSYLDRGNMGNAEIEGLSKDLGLSSAQYGWCLTVFFFGYSFFEVPSNMLLKKFKPSRWLPAIMVAWGIVMTLMGIVQNYHGLLVARLFLGIAEAGFFPGVAFYLTMWYRREESQFRQALFCCASSLAGAFSGFLSYAISKMNGIAGLEGWRWIFILEGIATVVAAIVGAFLIHDFPETASFLTQEEREFIVLRLHYQPVASVPDPDDADETQQSRQVYVPDDESFSWKYVGQAFSDWQVWLHILLYWSVICPSYGMGFFLPVIVRNLNYTSSQAQLMTIPIWITAALLTLVSAYFSDKLSKRSPLIATCLCLMLTGFVMCISSVNPHVTYAGAFLAVCGISPAFPGTVTWLSNNLAGSQKRGVGMALQIGIGNLGGAMASNFYRNKDQPRFFLGHGLEIAFTCMGLIVTGILVFSYRTINARRRRQLISGSGELSSNDMRLVLGDKAPTFRYMY